MGNKDSSNQNKVSKKVEELESKYKDRVNKIRDSRNKALIKVLEKERNQKIKYEMDIIVYSDEKISDSFKGMLNHIKHEEWKVAGYLENFSEDNSNKIIQKLKKDYEKKTFKNVILIPIKSINSFKETLMDNSKNIFDQFSDLEIDEQPFIIFIDYENKDFEYSIKELANPDNLKAIYYEKLINDEEIEININFDIKQNEQEKINILSNMIKRKKSHGDDFEIKVNNETFYKNLFGQEKTIIREIGDIFNFLNEKIAKDIIRISIINYNSNIDISHDINDLTNMGILGSNIQFYNYKSSKDKIIDNSFKNEYPDLDERNIKL